jgi:hypothetical protein
MNNTNAARIGKINFFIAKPSLRLPSRRYRVRKRIRVTSRD